MTSRPRLRLGRHLLPGLIAAALFAVLAAVAVTSSFPAAAGFQEGANITASIGYALFNIGAGDVPAEGFLAAFLIIAVVLDAALDGAVLLARQEEPGPSGEATETTAAATSGRPGEVAADGGDD